MTDSRGRDIASLFEMDLATGKKKLVLEDDKSDISDILVNPITKKIEAPQTNYDREHSGGHRSPASSPTSRPCARRWHGRHDHLQPHAGRRLLDRRLLQRRCPRQGLAPWTAAISRTLRKPTPAARTSTSPLADQPLVKMHVAEIKARDGLNMVSYLSLPTASDSDDDGRPNKPLPMVLLVHGGPWARDSWGYEP